MIVGSIKNGIKRLIEIPLRRQDKKDMQTWRANLIVRLASAEADEKKVILDGIRKIDNIIH